MPDERYRDRISDLDTPRDEDDEPRVYALERRGAAWGISRRSLLGMAAAAAAARCGTQEEPAPPSCAEAFAHTDWIHGLALSPDGALLASGSRDLTVKLWAMPEGGHVKTLEGHSGDVYDLAISADGTLLASGSWDGTVGLWSLPEGERRGTIEHPDGPVTSVALSPDGSLLVAAAREGGVRVWRLPQGEEVATWGEDLAGVRSMVFVPRGDLVACVNTGDGIDLRSVPAGDPSLTLDAAEVGSLAIHPDGSLLAAGTSTGIVRLWSLPDGEPAGSWLLPDNRAVKSLAFVGDGDRLASATAEWIVLNAVPGGVRLASARASQINAVVADPRGSFLASSGNDKTVRLWRLPELQHERCLMDLEASPEDTEGIEYEIEIEEHTVTYTLPCGSPIPPGAVCTCNCVPGSWDGVTTRRVPASAPKPAPAPPTPKPQPRPTPQPRRPTSTSHYWYPN